MASAGSASVNSSVDIADGEGSSSATMESKLNPRSPAASLPDFQSAETSETGFHSNPASSTGAASSFEFKTNSSPLVDVSGGINPSPSDAVNGVGSDTDSKIGKVSREALSSAPPN